MCDVALFWIPNKDPKAELGTRVYAETTKMELAVHPEFVDLLAMNLTLMERWNRIVAPGDKVYVVGEFGNTEWMNLLNGEIHIEDSVLQTNTT